MLKPLEVFENEEAEKLLEYFVAYRKLSSTADYLRCVAKVNSEVSFCENKPRPGEESQLNQLIEKK